MFNKATADLVDLHRRLWIEQTAELGYLPTSEDACLAVLDSAAWVIEKLGKVGLTLPVEVTS